MALDFEAAYQFLAVNLVEAVIQSERTECGLACLSILTRFYGQPHELTELRSKFKTANGVNLAQLAGFAHELGYVSRGLRLDMEGLNALRLPAILHWNLDHFVVLNRVRKNRVEIFDPALGRQWLSREEVSEKFTGVALEVWPGDLSELVPGDANKLDLNDIWRLTPERYKSFGTVAVLTIVLQVLLLVGPWHVQWLVDEALPTANLSLLAVLAIGFSGILILRSFVQWLRGVLVAELGHSLAFIFATRLLSKLMLLPLAWFQKRSVGDIVSRFESLAPIREFITTGAASCLVDVVLILFSLVLMVVYDPVLALVVVSIQIVAVGVCVLLGNRIREQNMRAVILKAQEQSHLLESVRAVHSVKVYGQEVGRLAAWQKLHGNTLDASLTLQRIHLGLGAWITFVAGVELIAVVSLGGLSVLEGTGFTIGMLMAFLSYRGHFSERLNTVVEQWLNFKTLRIHLQRLEDIWLQKAEPPPGRLEDASWGDGDLHLNQVSFSYDGKSKVLDRADLKIKQGRWVAIVGDSGVGKSTVMRLMMGLVAPDSGSVLVGDRALQDQSAVQFRRSCGCVLQEDGFFAGSIADNIALFEEPDMERVDKLISDVGLTKCIGALPLGSLAPIGEIDRSLSSGEMQRLFLARALYRNPSYLFLDEGTANLDPESASVIVGLVRDLNATRVTITHDQSFAMAADEVWELKEGRFSRLEFN